MLSRVIHHYYLRNSEVGMLISMAKLWALVNFTFGSVPFLTTLATFITYIFTSKVKR